MNMEKFNPSELCSRKLWQIVTEASSADGVNAGDNEALTEAVEELATRRHYMEKLLSSDRLAKLVRGSEHAHN